MKRNILFLSVILFFVTMLYADSQLKIFSLLKNSCSKINQQKETLNYEKKSKRNDDELIIHFYADTRGQPFSNWHQKRHVKFVEKMLDKENNKIKYLIFGGDNVWLGFINSQWNRFFKIMRNFTNKDIKIYPSLGNHELILSKFLYAAYKLIKKKENRFSMIMRTSKNKEDLNKKFKDTIFMESLVVKLKEIMRDPDFDNELKSFEEQLKKEDSFTIEEKAEIMIEIKDNIYPLAQEVSLFQLQTFSEKYSEQHPAHMKRFKKYVEEWKHLKEYLDKIQRDNKEYYRTYYSFKLPIDKNPKVKIIILDSNIRKDKKQKEWYDNQLKEKSPGLIIVVCHHPIFYPKKDWFDWQGSTPPHLVLTGHWHDYERLYKKDDNDKHPVFIISGSGGAHLESTSYIKEPELEKGFCYNYIRIVIKSNETQIIVFGCNKKGDSLTDLEKIDEFSFKF